MSSDVPCLVLQALLRVSDDHVLVSVAVELVQVQPPVLGA